MRWQVSHGKPHTLLFIWLLVFGLGTLPGAAWAEEQAKDEAAAHAQAKALSLAFRAAAKKALPTVVTIETQTKPTDSGALGQGPLPSSPLDELFGGHQAPGTRRAPRAPAPNLGSGVIIDPSGIVLTNNHVVSGADEVVVQLGDGRRFKVTDVKVDDPSDLAVIRFDAKGTLPAAKLGDSDQLEIGDWVLAIGNPYDLERTVSAGIISAKGRSIGPAGRSNYLQTDAAINPGNSGGPLVNLDGEIVGINTAIFSRSGGNQGIGFAIPSNMAAWVVPQLVSKGTVHRSYLGVALGTLSVDRAAGLGATLGQGVVVDKVFPDTPAAAAGLKENDVLLTIDETPLRNAADLQQLVERSQPNSPHQFKVFRDGKSLTLQVTLQDMPKDFATAHVSPSTEGDSAETRIYHNQEMGLIIGDLPTPLAKQFGVVEGSGVMVVRVESQSVAQRAGVRQGMVISQVGTTPIKNVADFKATLEGLSLNDGIPLQLQTQNGPKTVTLRNR